MARKTFNVQDFKNFINEVLVNDNLPFEVKNGYAMALDHVLHATGNYNGFRYVDPYNGDDPEFGFVDNEETGYPLTAKKAIRRRYH